MEAFARAVLLLVLLALFLAYLNHGWPGVRAWWLAKFLGRST